MNYLLGNDDDEKYIRVKQQSDRGDDGDGHAQHERHRFLGPRLRPVHLHANGVCLSRSRSRYPLHGVQCARDVTSQLPLHSIASFAWI